MYAVPWVQGHALIHRRVRGLDGSGRSTRLPGPKGNGRVLAIGQQSRTRVRHFSDISASSRSCRLLGLTATPLPKRHHGTARSHRSSTTTAVGADPRLSDFPFAPEEGRSSWFTPLIGQPKSKLYPARLVTFLSHQPAGRTRVSPQLHDQYRSRALASPPVEAAEPGRLRGPRPGFF